MTSVSTMNDPLGDLTGETGEAAAGASSANGALLANGASSANEPTPPTPDDERPRYIIVGAVRRVKSRHRRYAILHRAREERTASVRTLPPPKLNISTTTLAKPRPRKPPRDMSHFP